MVFLTALGVFATLFTAPVWGHQQRASEDTNTPEAEKHTETATTARYLPAQPVRPDHRLLRNLVLVERLAADGRYAEAARLLGQVLADPQDYTIQVQGKQVQVTGMKAEAERLLLSLGQGVLDQYRFQFGPIAKRQLEEACNKGDLAAVEEVAARYFLTGAGQEAVFLLVCHYMRAGRFRTVLRCIQRLREGPDAQRFEPALTLYEAIANAYLGDKVAARTAVDRLKTLPPQQLALLSAEQIKQVEKLLSQAERVNLAGSKSADRYQWVVFRANLERNADVPCSLPLLSPKWRAMTITTPHLHSLGETMALARPGYEFAQIPRPSPVVAGSVVVMRTLSGLLGVDLYTGKRLWATPAGGALGDPEANRQAETPPEVAGFAPDLVSWVWNRVFGNGVFGFLSTDGARVFAVEDTVDRALAPRFFGLGPFGAESDTITPGSNRLACYDLATGKLLWHLGGPETWSHPLPEAGAFFLGAPLPVDGRLYVLAVRGNMLMLMAIDPASGRLVWQQGLGQFQLSEQDYYRLDILFVGLSPTFTGELLLCPLPNQTVVAVDPILRKIAWTFSYARSELGNFMPYMEMTSSRDFSIIVGEGCAVFAPPDSNLIYCLDASTGQLRWTVSAEGVAYLGGIYDGKVIVVGHRFVRAYLLGSAKESEPSLGEFSTALLEVAASLFGEPVPRYSDQPKDQTAKAAWNGKTVFLPLSLQVAGYGFRSGNRYYLPLTEGNLAVIDLDNGHVVQMYQTDESIKLGNLIVAGPYVLSQTVSHVDAFPQLDYLQDESTKRLANNPNDPHALVDLGLLYRHQEDYERALEVFAKAYQLTGWSRARKLAVDTFLRAASKNLAAASRKADLIEQLLQTREEKAAFLRVKLLVARQADDYEALVDYLLRLYDMAWEDDTVIEVAPQHYARLSSWLNGQLQRCYEQLPPECRKRISQYVASKQEALRSGFEPEMLERFYVCFRGLPGVDQVLTEALATMRKGEKHLLYEQWLLRTTLANAPEQRLRRLEMLAEWYAELGLWYDLAGCVYRARLEQLELGLDLSDYRFDQLLQSLDVETRRQIEMFVDPWRHWRQADIVSEQLPGQRQPSQVQQPLAIVGISPVSVYSDELWFARELVSGASINSLVCRDMFGRPMWTLYTNRVPQSVSGPLQQPMRSRGVLRRISMVANIGHLLLTFDGQNLAAWDTLDATMGNPPQLLWKSTIADMTGDYSLGQQVPGGLPQTEGIPIQRMPLPQQSAQLLVIAENIACIRYLHHLIVFDPLVGRLLWYRRDVVPDGDVFGDQDYLITTHSDDYSVTIYRASDGSFVAKRNVLGSPVHNFAEEPWGLQSRWPESGISFGRYSLRSSVFSLFERCTLVDPLDDTIVWQAKQEKRAETFGWSVFKLDRWHIVNAGDGGAVIRRLDTGRIVAKILPPNRASLYDVGQTVLSNPWSYLVGLRVWSDEGGQQKPGPPQVAQPWQLCVQLGSSGYVYGYDRFVGKQWDKMVEVQETPFLCTRIPPGLPIVLLGAVRLPGPNSTNRRPQLLITCLDARTGKKIYSGSCDYRGQVLNVVGDPEKQTIDIWVGSQTIRLHFSSSSTADRAAATGDASSPPRGTTDSHEENVSEE